MDKIEEFFDNQEEIAWGSIYGVFSCLIFGWWSLATGLLCAILWRLGGQVRPSIRRFGIPLVVATMYLSLGLSWFPLFYYVMTAATLSIGYGQPDEGDQGSALGRFWYNVFNDYERSKFATRGTIVVLLLVSMIPLAMHVDKIRYDKEIQEVNDAHE